MYPSVVSHRWASLARRQYLVSPVGMLDSWALKNSAFKKRVATWLFERRNLLGAACLHALSEEEAAAIRAFGLRNPVCVIPNGVDVPVGRPTGDPSWARQIPPGVKVLLFLGRLHPKKGLSALLHGWAAVQHPRRDHWRLVIIGWGQGRHETELHRLVSELGLSEQVRFFGPQFGQEKAATLARADAFVLPSFSEGLPVAVLEAWAHGLPVLMTPQCNLSEGFEIGAALRVEPEAGSLANGLEELFGMRESDRLAVGERGRRLVEARFSWPKIASEMRQVYEWMLGARAKPASVWTQ
jgi:poly(glycerol-phosphate) alpha-glucosyltransferase